MLRILTPAAILTAGAAQAHPGHIAELAGHAHLSELAIGAVVALGLAAAVILRARRS